MSNVIAQAQASFARISVVLSAQDPLDTGTIENTLEGYIEVNNVTVTYGQKTALKNIFNTFDASIDGATKTLVSRQDMTMWEIARDMGYPAVSQ